MKKAIIAALLISAATVSAMAQSPGQNSYFGLRVGVDMATPSASKVIDQGLYKLGGGFHVEGVYSIPLASNFYFEPGLGVYYNTWSIKDLKIDEHHDVSNSFRNWGLSVPIVFGYGWQVGDYLTVSPFTGPTMRIGLSNKFHAKVGDSSDSESVYGDNGLFNRFDLAWRIGVGFTYDQVHFQVTADLGMLNLYKDAHNQHFRQNVISVAVGYNF